MQPAPQHGGAKRHDGILDTVLQRCPPGEKLHLLGVVLHGGEGHERLFEGALARGVSFEVFWGISTVGRLRFFGSFGSGRSVGWFGFIFWWGD